MFREMMRARRRFLELREEMPGADSEAIGEKLEDEYRARGIDPATLAAIIAFIQMLIELFSKK